MLLLSAYFNLILLTQMKTMPPKNKRAFIRASLQPHLYGIRRHFAKCNAGYFRVGNYWKCRQCLRWMPRGFTPARFNPLECLEPGKRLLKYPRSRKALTRGLLDLF